MNSNSSQDSLPRHLLIAFILAVVGYGLFFFFDQHLRVRKGPWVVTFTTNENGFAQIIINQPKLHIDNVRVTFLQEHTSNAPAVLRFDHPMQALPFGTNRFEDLTYLPGSETFDFFGHVVELLPRTLYLNQKEQPWVSGKTYELSPSEKLPPSAFTDPRKKKRRF
jgi:hypothetical protein